VRYLVVHAHPDPTSFNRVLCDTAVAALERAGHDVVVVDLYAEQFAAAMSAAERDEYHGASPVLDPQVQRYADALTSCDGLVFVYPTWWWGLPAILKGFLDRVLVPGVAFRLDPKSNKVKAGLRHVRHIVGISTYGSSRLYMRLFNDAGRRQIMRCIRLLTAVRCRTTWLGLYNMDAATEQDRRAFLARVDRMLGAR
jgi:NAD(P)H dehydrogenase (quinone)